MSPSLRTVNLRFLWLPLLILAWFAPRLHAHRPVFVEDAATSPDTAIRLKEPHISQVVYREITKKSSAIWLSVDVPRDFRLFVQIGVPVIDRLEKFRPAIAVVGPGLPGGKVPFKTPKATGAKVLATSDVSKPRFFHEHFTGTESWIHIEVTRTLRRSGTHYLVAYTPDDPKPGDKLWLSMGRKERFKLRDLFTFRRWKREIREFHELR